MSEVAMRAGYFPKGYALKNLIRRALHVDVLGPSIPPEERAIITDISHWQGNVNFTAMQAAGARASIAKCVQGITLPDDKYPSFVAGDTVIPLGSYDFLLNINGTTQADYYTSHLLIHLIPFTYWADVEQPTMFSSYIYQWAVKTKTNLHMVDYSLLGIYTSAYYWSLVVDDGYKAWCSRNLMLWVADYSYDAPRLPTGWTDYAIHQYNPNGDGHLYGCDSAGVDLNRCRKSWLQRFESQKLTIEQRVDELEERMSVVELWQTLHG